MLLPQLILNSLIAGGIYSVLALGFNYVYKTTKFFNLAHGTVSALGSYAVYSLFIGRGWGLAVAIPAGMLFAGVVGWLLDRLVYYPLRKREASAMVLLVASLGTMTLLQSAIALAYGSHFRSFAEKLSPRVFEIGGATITSIHITILCAVLLVGVGIHLLLTRTHYGKSVQAVADDIEVAKIVGIRTDRVIGWTFFIGSALAGLAGILVSFDIGLEPVMGMGLLLKAATASIIGGIGSVAGAVCGGFLLGAVENFGIWKLASEWKDLIVFSLLILFLLARPQGIWSGKK